MPKYFKELMNLIFLMLGSHVLQIEMLCLIVLRPFPNDGIKTVRQGFGDSNQAIYNYVNEDVQDSEFPRSNPPVCHTAGKEESQAQRKIT